jgi:hypothetical protein
MIPSGYPARTFRFCPTTTRPGAEMLRVPPRPGHPQLPYASNQSSASLLIAAGTS